MDIYGIIGWPIGHSLSPVMHNAAFKHLGVDAEYRLFAVRPEQLQDFLFKDFEIEDEKHNKVRTKDIKYFNVTIPYKVSVRELLEKRFPIVEKEEEKNADLHYVRLTGAVNTVKKSKDRIEYCNTDPYGFLTSLQRDLGFDTKGKTIFLMGCGGAGRAVMAALSLKELKVSKLYIYDINENAIQSAKDHIASLPQGLRARLEREIEFISKDMLPDKIKASQLLVNATNVGMNPGDACVVDEKLLHKGLAAYDLVYNRETRLVRFLKSLNRPAVSGIGMLLYQGAHSFTFWTGKEAPIEVMREALLRVME